MSSTRTMRARIMRARSTSTRTPAAPGRPDRRTRYARAHVLVAAWLGLALLAATADRTLPVARWLAVHLFLLGGATTAVLLWSEHFAVALLHARQPAERWSRARLLGANAAVLGVLTGVWAELPVLTGAACLALVTAVVAHLVVLVRLGRGALGGRLAPVVGYYRAAAAALVVGALLGWALAAAPLGDRAHADLRLAHVHVVLFGWIGLPVLGTLFMLWPTVLGVPMRDRTARVARRVLWLTGGGLAVAVAALTAGWRWPAAAGVAGYAVGAGAAAGLFVRTVRRRAAVSAAAAWMLAAGLGWLLVALVGDLLLLGGRPLTDTHEGVDALVPVLLVGFVGQSLVGALTYLLPVVLGRGPARRAELQRTLEGAWRARLPLLNLAVPLLALPLPSPAAPVGALLAGAGVAVFLVLVLRVLRRSGDAHPARSGRSAHRGLLLGTAAGTALTVAAALVAGSGGTAPHPPAAAAAGTRTVEIFLESMRVSPNRVEVPHGTAVRLVVTNRDTQRHDLTVQDGPATPLLGRGETRTLDLGPLTADRRAWCSVPGHKAAGMRLVIVVGHPGAGGGTGSSAGGASTGAGGSTGGHSGAGAGTPEPSTAAGHGPDPAGDFSPGWRPRAADLPAADGGTVHRVELHAVTARAEVAPGVTQELWTFGGTAPGPTLRGRVGDTFEVTLVNDDTMGHGIDFHAGALAPDGPMRTIAPGERLVYRFTADRAGAWLYHCSAAPMLQHMGNGMYGAVVIDPPGLAPVDREYLLVSSELYLGEPGGDHQTAALRAGTPDAWAFNGVAAQYAAAPLTARAGQRVRFWVVAAGPTGGIAFHVVGAVFDTVYKEGAYLLTPSAPGGSQVFDLAAAQGGFVETAFAEAGHYPFVDHDMRHAEAGARGLVEVR
ncbi:multicopper oxidase domain-containing protein [Kitasatospora sp. NPDC090091]|uniref:multicopper oxidase domain-containing protein n=1 Tax=Kitasatospora sp. NPDC090091 TaxID=3364081 RepID=UPI0037FCAB42